MTIFILAVAGLLASAILYTSAKMVEERNNVRREK